MTMSNNCPFDKCSDRCDKRDECNKHHQKSGCMIFVYGLIAFVVVATALGFGYHYLKQPKSPQATQNAGR